jgi:hypothetical protein
MKEQQELLQQGYTIWNQWRKDYPDEEIDLREVDLHKTDLQYVDLRWANLEGANLEAVNLHDADLREAVLCKTNLKKANLAEVDLRWAVLHKTNLEGANLDRTNLSGAVLQDMSLQNCRITFRTIGIHPAPQGTLIAWKKCYTMDDKYNIPVPIVIQLQIPHNVPRSCGTTRKFRSQSVVVMDIPSPSHTAYTKYHNIVTWYQEGQSVEADMWDTNQWEECSHGIHWFLTQEEAMSWDLPPIYLKGGKINGKLV